MKTRTWKLTSDPLKIHVPDKVRRPDWRMGATVKTQPHVITWIDYDSGTDEPRHGQVWSLAPADSDWDSATYWVVPFDAPRTIVKVAKRGNHLVQVPEWHYR